MADLFRDYWWLMFPLGGFAFAGFGMFMGMQAHRDRLSLLRTYAEKGQTPPPELAESAMDPYGPGAYGPYGGYGYGDRYARRMWRRQQRRAFWGPVRDYRRFVFFMAVSIGFLVAAFADGDGRSHHGFILVAIVTGALSIGSLLAALPMMGRGQDPDQQPTK